MIPSEIRGKLIDIDDRPEVNVHKKEYDSLSQLLEEVDAEVEQLEKRRSELRDQVKEARHKYLQARSKILPDEIEKIIKETAFDSLIHIIVYDGVSLTRTIAVVVEVTENSIFAVDIGDANYTLGSVSGQRYKYERASGMISWERYIHPDHLARINEVYDEEGLKI